MILSLLFDLAPCAALTAYLFFLVYLRLRQRTTVLSGRTDRLLLALGLSGIVVFDIGPAVIPLGSLDLYGGLALLLFFLLYLQVVFYLDSSFSRRIIVYNLGESDFDAIPAVPIPQWNVSGETPSADPTRKSRGPHPEITWAPRNDEPRNAGTLSPVIRWNKSVPRPANNNVVETFRPVIAGTRTVAPNIANMC